jgi:hypothetical protein
MSIRGHRNINHFVLNESQESDSQKLSIQLVMDKFGWDKERANQFVRVDLRNDITSLRDKKIGKFTLGVTRMFIDGDLQDANTISSLNYTLKLLSAHLNEYDKNLNGLSAQELISRFEQVRQDNLEQNKKDIGLMSFGKSDYDIVRIDSFEQAKQYYKYTNPDSRWCLTHMEDQYMNYTCNEINQLYFCLKRGFENVKRIARENTPLDEYGLSMISVIVNENGELVNCTCRWNHDNGGTDNVMDEKQISEVVNVNFYQTFKPNNKWNDIVNRVLNRIMLGESPEDAFDDCGSFHEGFAAVMLNDRWNFIDKNNEILSKQWFDDCDKFVNGFARVNKNYKMNFINIKGGLVSSKWFNSVGRFRNGLAVVEDKNKWNLINVNGELLSKQWFDNVTSFTGKFSIVRLNGKYNLIDSSGELLYDQWFDEIDTRLDIFNMVYLEGKYNFVNDDGKLLFKQWFDDCEIFTNNPFFYKVKLKEKYNVFNAIIGELLSEQWFDGCETYIFDERIEVKLNKKYMYLGVNGELYGDTQESLKYIYKNILKEQMMDNNNILYISVDLDNESRLKLKSFCEPTVQDMFGEDAVYKCHHMTISTYKNLDDDILSWCEENEGNDFTLYVDSIGVSDKAVSVAIDVDGVMTKQAYPHITVAVNPLTGGRPVDSNYITNFEEVYHNIELHGKLVFHYKNENTNTTLIESEIRKSIQQLINESWVDGDNNPDIIDYLNDYQGTDFIPEELYSYDLRHWVLTSGDFLYAYDFPIGGLKIRAANTVAIIEDIANDLEECGYIKHTHEIDELLLKRENEFKNMYVAVYKVCDVPGSKDYYVVYQQER